MTLDELRDHTVNLRSHHTRLRVWCVALGHSHSRGEVTDCELEDACRERDDYEERAERAEQLYEYAVEHGLAAAMLWKLANA